MARRQRESRKIGHGFYKSIKALFITNVCYPIVFWRHGTQNNGIKYWLFYAECHKHSLRSRIHPLCCVVVPVFSRSNFSTPYYRAPCLHLFLKMLNKVFVNTDQEDNLQHMTLKEEKLSNRYLKLSIQVSLESQYSVH